MTLHDSAAADSVRSRSDLDVDALVIGAGFAGMYQLHRLRKLGLRTRVLDRAAGVGGTWYWNRYPGARCDIPSLFYTVSYTPELNEEWQWTERFATHDAIRAYMEEVARREDMYRDITFETSLVSADWDESTATWTSTTHAGEHITSRYLILATGALSESRVPELPGLNDFGGRWFNAGRWPHEPVDFTGRKVAVIGTGSTGVQVIPVVAKDAAEVVVFQRTPKFIFPAANVPMTDEESRPIKDAYPELRKAARRGDYGTPFPAPEMHLDEMSVADREELMEGLYNLGGLGGFIVHFSAHLGLKKLEVNDIVADFARKKIREIVKDPATAEALTPYGYPIGINRIIIGTDYYETFNLDKVRLHSVIDDPIVEVTATGLKTTSAEFEVDDIIFATGYDGLTGSFTAIDVYSRTGTTIRERWADGPSTYLGMQMADFPNLFLITGPGGPSVLSNVITTTEQSIDFITGLIEHARADGLEIIEPDSESESRWMDHVAEVAQGSLYRYAFKANSWYTGLNVPGKKVVFMPYAGGVGTFQDILDGVAADGYRGFRCSVAPRTDVLAGQSQPAGG
ncbi:NAD(P)/FAD-dependent oxidoreductase [Mycobacterium sp. DL440]|uniref:flavin-containing monooxygenase n=1 Tax=Mycobacterium sp. DL440 TaxID=2675523 RepID=UPI0014236587|nr:NAD(P)/FAD-dependent oxidoreductase [Mycobacterium sp. DL440]